MPMECRYNFVIRPPGNRVQVLINEDDAEGRLLVASFTGKRQELTDKTILGALARHPLMTLKIMVGIHYEALKIFLKGIPYVPRSPGDGGNVSGSGPRRPHHSARHGKEQTAR
jgi:uncharacterized protein